MSWVYLDDAFPDHPKVVAAGGDAAWLFVCALAYVKRYETEGFIPAAQVPRLTDRKSPNKLAARLVEVALWDTHPDGFMVHDYHDWNRPGHDRKEKARKAARARWDRPPPPDDPPEDAPSNASSNAHASETHMPPDAQYPVPRPPLLTSVQTSPSQKAVEKTVEAAAVIRARNAARANLTACPQCDDTGHVDSVTNPGAVMPCPECRPGAA